jgi:glycosyltransferase involved in cell wall biosynthesis
MKGHDFLIRAFHQLLQEFKNLKLIIIGEDFGYKKPLIDLIQSLKLKNSVILNGKISNELLIGAYSAASIYVQPSKFEVFGMAVFEAAACETPVVVTKVGAFKNLITNGVNGYTVEFNDIDRLTEIFSNLLKNKQKREEIGRNSRRLINILFNWNIIGEKIENIYKKAIFEC